MPDVGIKILTAFACLTGLVAIPSISGIMPNLLGCLIRWRESVNLHSSVSLSRMRNLAAIAVAPAFILMCSHFRLIPWTEDYGEWTALGYTALTSVLYATVRYLCRQVFRGNRLRPSDFLAATETIYSFFLLGVIMMSISFCTCFAVNAPSDVVTVVLKTEIIVLYAMSVLRETQIFTHYGGISSGFLYLCTLECLPTGLLIASMLLI